MSLNEILRDSVHGYFVHGMNIMFVEARVVRSGALKFFPALSKNSPDLPQFEIFWPGGGPGLA
jgi:hypothetical protein